MLIIFYCFFYLTQIIIDRVLYLEYLHSMHNYLWLITFIIFPVLYFITLSFFVIYSKLKKKDNNNNIHQKHLFLFGLLSIISNFLYTISISNLSLVSYIVSSKINFLCLISFSYFFLKRRYRYTHILGSLLCIVGVLITIVKNSEKKEDNFGYIFLFMLGVVTDCISSVYKEYFIKKIENFDIFRFEWNINVWQIFWSCVLFFTVFLPEFNQQKVTPSNLGEFLLNGLKCEFNGNEGNCKKAVIYLFSSHVVTIFLIFTSYKIVKLWSSMAINLLICIKGPLFLITMYLLLEWKMVDVSEAESKNYTLEIIDYFSLALTFIGSLIYFMKKEYTFHKPVNNDLVVSLIE